MDARSIVREWLEAHGLDGLCSDGCGCGSDDLAPCGCIGPSCRPAVRVECPCCGEAAYVPAGHAAGERSKEDGE